MKIEPYEKNYFFNQCDPTIKSSLSQEQAREVKRLLELSMQCNDTKVTKVNFDIWFFGFYFVTLYLGKEQRLSLRRFHESAKIEILFSLIGIVFSFFFTFSMIFAIFMALYYVKTFAGINLFEDKHLSDIMK
ncbi:MAG: hypothetical protein ACI81I_000376 [Arcobacteraceae bacterium]|jgi:hypothetical protein